MGERITKLRRASQLQLPPDYGCDGTVGQARPMEEVLHSILARNVLGGYVDYKRLLFPVDFSEACQRTAASVRQLTTRFGSDLTLLHVVEFPYAWSGEIDPMLLAGCSWDDLRVTETRKLEEFGKHKFPGMALQTLSVKGDPARLVSQIADEKAVDLVMMPTHGYGRFRAALLGSVTAKVIHDTKVPVWTDVHGTHSAQTRFPYENITCAVDQVEESSDLLRYAASLARHLDSNLIVVHAAKHSDAAHELEARCRIKEILTSVRAEACVCMAGGQVEDVVVQAAKAHHADILVIGRGHMPKALGPLRSHVYGIIANSPCPIITV